MYVAEAHACDEWPLGRRVVIAQHRSAGERARAARRMVDETGLSWLHVVLDTEENAFDAAYACWPLRAYGFLPSKSGLRLSFVAQPQDGTYPFEDVEAWVAALGAS